jgi:hypothetical protein
MITTTNLTVGAFYGARLRVESAAPMHAWTPQRPGRPSSKTDNSRGMSAWKRRLL